MTDPARRRFSDVFDVASRAASGLEAARVRRPSGRRAGVTIGRGLAEAARAPVHVAGAVYEISTLPLRSARSRLTREQDG